MMIKSRVLMLAWALLATFLSACGANSSAPQPSSAAPPTPASLGNGRSTLSAEAAMTPRNANTSQTPATASMSGLRKGMAYADLRTAVLADGWQPAVDLKCKANMAGAAYKELCANGSDSCKACDDLPELSACSGDAACVMNFRSARDKRHLQVSTYGDIGDRTVHGSESQLDVTGWKVSPSQ
ncbi:MAG: hypothetical protein ABI389_06585 [Rhodanobacter sp.]